MPLGCKKALCTALLLAVAWAGWAQAQSTSSLTGLVTDPSGAVVPGAAIVVVNSDTNSRRDATTDGQGRYSFPQMQMLQQARGGHDGALSCGVLEVADRAAQRQSEI